MHSDNNNEKIQIMYKMTLLSKNLKIEKKCNTERECFVFERDMPAKYNLLFSKETYIIVKKYL